MRYFYFGDDTEFLKIDEQSLSYDAEINYTYGRAKTFKISEENLKKYNMEHQKEQLEDDQLEDYFNEFKLDIFKNSEIEEDKEISL